MKTAAEKWKAKITLPTFPLLLLYLSSNFKNQNEEAWRAELRSTP